MVGLAGGMRWAADHAVNDPRAGRPTAGGLSQPRGHGWGTTPCHGLPPGMVEFPVQSSLEHVHHIKARPGSWDREPLVWRVLTFAGNCLSRVLSAFPHQSGQEAMR